MADPDAPEISSEQAIIISQGEAVMRIVRTQAGFNLELGTGDTKAVLPFAAENWEALKGRIDNLLEAAAI